MAGGTGSTSSGGGAVPVQPPDGSASVDAGTVIDAGLLATLSDATKSSLLAVGNIGAATIAKVTKVLELLGSVTSLDAYLLDGTQLDGLADGSETSRFVYTSPGTSRFVRVVVLLGRITPTAAATVQLTDGTTVYELGVTASASEKRVEFNAIPAAYVQSFSVVNRTGVPFAAYGNSLLVVGL